MKLLTFAIGATTGFGVLRDDGIVDITKRLPHLTSMREALEADALDEIARATADGPADHQVGDVSLLPVVTNPGKILCAGVNYRAHRDETGNKKADYPTIFIRLADSQIGAGAPAIKPHGSERFDYEGELAVIIGRGGSSISEADAFSHIAGYACYNDFTARDWQRHSSQWTAGKNFSGTGAFGPTMVTADEVLNLDELSLETRVNGEVRQSAPLSDLIFSIPELIAYVSKFTPLAPGDVIVTGTPGGVGMFRDPQVFLTAGDVVDVEITNVGLLTNVVANDRSLSHS